MTQKTNNDDKGQYSKKIVKCLTTTRSKKELCIFAGKIDKKSSSYCCLRSFGRSGNKFPAIKSISNNGHCTGHYHLPGCTFQQGRRHWGHKGAIDPPPLPYFDRIKTSYMKLPYDIPCLRHTSPSEHQPILIRESLQGSRILTKLYQLPLELTAKIWKKITSWDIF